MGVVCNQHPTDQLRVEMMIHDISVGDFSEQVRLIHRQTSEGFIGLAGNIRHLHADDVDTVGALQIVKRGPIDLRGDAKRIVKFTVVIQIPGIGELVIALIRRAGGIKCERVACNHFITITGIGCRWWKIWNYRNYF